MEWNNKGLKLFIEENDVGFGVFSKGIKTLKIDCVNEMKDKFLELFEKNGELILENPSVKVYKF